MFIKRQMHKRFRTRISAVITTLINNFVGMLSIAALILHVLFLISYRWDLTREENHLYSWIFFLSGALFFAVTYLCSLAAKKAGQRRL
jgi:drug/metabolite transporter (DMT)-like permease